MSSEEYLPAALADAGISSKKMTARSRSLFFIEAAFLTSHLLKFYFDSARGFQKISL